MPVQDQDRGVTLPYPVKSREVYKGDNPAVASGTGSKIEFVEEIYRGNVQLRVDEFTDFAPNTVLSTTTGWQAQATTGTPGSNGIKANTANGIFEGVLAVTNEAETVGVDWAGQLIIPATKRFYFETLIRIPTAITTAQNLIVGLQTAYNATLDSTTKFVRFRTNASMAVKAEFQDGTTTDLAQSLNRGGFTITANTWTLFAIDATKAGVIRFFINEALYYTHSIGAFAVTDLLQPAIYLNKASGTGVQSLQIDWARVGWNRF